MTFIKTAVKAILVYSCMLAATSLRAQDVDYTPLSGDFDFLAVEVDETCHGFVITSDGHKLIW